MSHPTIRNLTGAAAPESIDPTRSALLLIDFQNEYFTGRMPLPDGERALRNARRLAEHADQSGIPVFHVQHVTPAGSPIFAEDSASGAFHRDLQPAAQHRVVRKTSVSVFPTTDLDQQLRDAGVDTLIIAGLMTHACVAGAARDAVPLGYSVLVAGDACATRDLDSGDGVDHAALHRAALASIDDTFGDILSTEQILALQLR
ncbi:cysteine hydrolase family protein [Pseudomonas sp. JS3066]|jgi:nicotinamidase-related amidase|uniref:cysteine hydrolase family protein n=1 Tax=unclassified Pseudomonas TaxID=196821 RepID=UPI000EAA54AF|nr:MULTISPECIES: cysteine hydrolase family protein [unclassified Pseudomonas]AYF86495.1 cysteine hydrolase [Pseudomonas sp. DY-1]MDH4654784.1 cysteine hydrolase [Pseudomonas sp. BN606]MRK23832.1 cysteine hydrolase [Pseudomonas sp. JG-B]WVK96050.1 cysteine hydrolase family protein [Pseudomonas sp. JS3066]